MVYVDPLHGHITANAPRCFVEAGRACHLYADTEQELHAFAVRIGLRRAWFQHSRMVNHYDLTPYMRQRAVRMGAVEHTPMEAVAKWGEIRQRRQV